MSNISTETWINKTFGNLKVLAKADKFSDRRGILWVCECSCGIICNIYATNLRTGQTTKCKICSKRKGLSSGTTGLNILFSDYKCTADKRNYCFELTLKQFKEIISQNCYYCKEIPKQVSKNGHKKISEETREYSSYIYNGIDRKDNTLGYILENCLPCCRICNRAKSDMPYEDFMKWLERFK